MNATGENHSLTIGTSGDTQISLTRDELVWLNDRISGKDIGYDGTALFPALDPNLYRELRLKIASGFVQALSSHDPLEMRFQESELWVLKDKIMADDVKPSDKEFGLRLVRKICEALLELDRREF